MKKIEVLMSTYNGEKYIREQIDSILHQSGVSVHILVRDDGSSDSTKSILNEYQAKGQLKWYEGENIGAKYSFLDVLQNAEEAEYYAFSDQDDVWLPNKIKEALNKIEMYQEEQPILYYSETMQVDNQLRKTNYQFHSGKPYKFGQILIKNHASGCTMVFNRTLQQLIKKQDYRQLENIPYHDHWIYMVCLACGGKVIYDSESYILYRQHNQNVIGANRSLLTKLNQNGILNHDCNRYHWTQTLYLYYVDDMSYNTKEMVKKVLCYKKSKWNRLVLALDNKIKPSNYAEKILILVSVLLGRF